MTEENNNQEINVENTETTEKKKHWTAGNEETLKWVLIWFAAFLGGFFAVMVFNTCIPCGKFMPPPPPYHHMGRHFQPEHFMPDAEFDVMHEKFKNKDFEGKRFDNRKRNVNDKKQLPNANPIGRPSFNSVVNIEELPDKYKIIINLRRFNNDEKNVKVDIKAHSIKISGNAVNNTEEEQSSFSYSKTLTVSRKIDTDDVKKEVLGNKLIITAPIED